MGGSTKAKRDARLVVEGEENVDERERERKIYGRECRMVAEM